MEIGVIEAPTVRQLFIEKIARLIITGQLRPGDRLPSEIKTELETLKNNLK